MNQIKETHTKMDILPVESLAGIYEVRTMQWGGFNVSFEKALADIDMDGLFNGAPNNRCQCPHWGFLIRGKMISRYKNHEETINAGEAYYLAPDHVVFVAKDTEMIEFSPLDEHDKTMEIVVKNLPEYEAKIRQ
jgi:hypothetical protein